MGTQHLSVYFVPQCVFLSCQVLTVESNVVLIKPFKPPVYYDCTINRSCLYCNNNCMCECTHLYWDMNRKLTSLL